jgi:heme exporter protein C
LTSELILLFLYLAYISLNNAFDNPKTADKASSVLAIVGLVNIPIIYYSVEVTNANKVKAAPTGADTFATI